MFEIHNEPNLHVEGHTICWNNGAEFAGFLARALVSIEGRVLKYK